MATLEKKEVEVIRISKQELFDDLKTANPTVFGSKVWADVQTIAEEEGDASYIAIKFKAVVI